MPTDPSARFRREAALFFLAALLLCAASSYGQWFRAFDLMIFDVLVSATPAPLDDELLIVGIDEQSLASLGAWPWPRDQQAALLEAISEAGPAAVLVDVVYGGASDAAADSSLVAAAAGVDKLALPVVIDALAADRQLIEVLPFPDLLDVTDVLGHVHVELDEDAVARGVYLYQGISGAHWPHLSLALATQLGLERAAPSGCDAAGFSMQNLRCDFVYLSFAGPPGSLPEVSALDVLEGRVPPAALRGRKVFVGITTAAAPDSITSPVSGNERPMAGVEFNANLFNTLTTSREVSPAPSWLVLLLALLGVMLPALTLPRLRPKSMLAAALGLALLPLLITATSYVFARLHVPLAAAVVTCLLAYPYWSWRRHEIAWRFVAGELARMADERSRWSRRVPGNVTDAAERLARLLKASWRWLEEGPAEERGGELTVRVDAERALVLSRAEPFSERETRLAGQLAQTFSAVDAEDQALPGEVLAAQIRRLKSAAEEVRLGREVGLRGLEEMPIGVAVLSALDEVLLVNEAGRKLLAVEDAASSFESLVDGLVAPLGTSWQDIRRRVVLGDETVTFETQTRTGVPVVVEAAPLVGAGEAPETWVLTVTDLSDVRVAERHREEALAFLSHDLRSPMLSVLALVRSPEAGASIDEIGRYAQKALAVSEQFLQLSRVQARERFETYEVDLTAVLSNAVDQVYREAREKDIPLRLQLCLEDESGAWIIGNGELLERALVNLLTNAVKYSAAGSPVDASLGEGPGVYALTVEDRGIGIPAEEVDRVFDPYFRSAEPQLAEQRGSGLGLRFVKTVVERHGGEVTVESRFAHGSRFVVTLPRLEEPSA